MLTFKITENSIKKRIARYTKRLATTDKVMKKIAIDMRKEVNNRFEEETDPRGKKWKRLSANTSAYKAKFEKGDKILNDSGKLKRSIKNDSTNDEARVYTNNIYAATHQFGVKNRKIVPKQRKNPKKNKSALFFYTAGGWASAKEVKISIPARPFMGLNKKQYKKYIKMVREHLNK